MKNYLLALLSFISLSAMAQGTLTVSVSDSGTAAPGVAVFYYDSPASFYPNGYNNPPVIENFDSYAFTSGNGVATFSLSGISNLDTVFWATQDCSGNLVWGADYPTATNPNISGNLFLNCMPGDCDAILTVDSAALPAGNLAIIQAFPLRQFSYTSLPNNIPSAWSVNGSFTSGFTSADYDSTTFFMNSTTAPYAISYSRVDSLCSPRSISFGNSSGTSVVCSPMFSPDSTSQTPAGYQMTFTNTSTSNGTIINYSWDFGNGIVFNSPNPAPPMHTFPAVGTYTVCLTITAVLGTDTCMATYCDSSVVVVPVGLSCAANYSVDTLNSGSVNNQILIYENALSSGTITSWSWDFGDGTTINTRYPSHTYAATGVYNVCLTITATDGNGGTCTSTFCDSIGFDANGNLVYKTGFTINVVDPNVGLEDDLLTTSLSMFPNPSRGVVNLEWDEQLELKSLKVYSISGSLVKQIATEGNSAKIDALKPGAYLVRVESLKASRTLRLIVQ